MISRRQLLYFSALLFCCSPLANLKSLALATNKKKYSGFFFRTLAKKIEQLSPNYFVCEICGSTIDEKPEKPCIICNYPKSHYINLKRPVL